MDFSIDKNLASPYVQNNGIDSSRKVKPLSGPYKTNPLIPDSFRKEPASCLQYSQTEKLYQKLLEAVAPSILLDSYLNETAIKKMMENNPKVQEILTQNNLPTAINIANVKGIKEVHLNSTERYAMGIADKLNLSKEDKDIISRGAIFHDFGKVLIPPSLLNKKGKLTPEEKRIVDLHSTLGYELLKTTSMKPEVLEIVRNHHKSLDKEPDFRTQIVSVADIYSALRTKRSYKTSLTQDQSMFIMKKYAEMGKIDPGLIKALKLHVAPPMGYIANANPAMRD